nr:hypothetical protein [Tanacetum cinerariifolium]
MHPNRRKITELDANEDVTLEDVDAEVEIDANIQGRMGESQAKPSEVEEVLEVVTTAKFMTEVVTTAAPITTVAQVSKPIAPRKRSGVVIQDPEETAAASVIDEAFARQLEAKLNANINWNDVMEQVKRREKQNNTGMRPIFEKHYNSIKAFLEKGKNEIKEEGSKRKGENLEQDTTKKQRIDEEELKRHLHIIANDDDDVYIESTPLASMVLVVDYQIHHENNKPYYKIIRADGTHKLFLSFITLLKNFDKEDLETLWTLVKERFESTEPKTFSDDFLINTL